MSDTTLIEVTTEPQAIGRIGAIDTGSAGGRQKLMQQLEDFFGKCAGGLCSPGTIVGIQQNAGESSAQASATLTMASVAAGDGVLVNGVLFVATANAATTAGGGEFTETASNTTTAANLAAAINASTDARIKGVITASSAAAVVTIKSVDQSLTANSVDLQPVGQVARANVAYSSSSGAQTVVVNGVSLTVGTGASDAANAALCATAINGSANALVKNLVVAYQGGGANNTSCYVYSLVPGVIGNTTTLSVTGTGATASAARLASGVANVGGCTSATGTWTVTSGSGSETATINGVAVNVTWTSSDNNTATLMANAINQSVNALVQGVVYATAAANVVTITATESGTPGNQITLAASGTGAAASGARLTGGAVPTTITTGAAGVVSAGTHGAGVILTGGIGGEGTQTNYTF